MRVSLLVLCAALWAGCDPECPAGPVQAGAICKQKGGTACAGATVLSCGEAPGMGDERCYHWAPVTDCALAQPGPLTCGRKAGAAGCECPAPSGDDVLVDPAAGGVAAAAPFASGAAEPAICRFRSVGEALNATKRAGARVVVGANAAALPLEIRGETVPLVVAPGVTLTSAEPTAPEKTKIVVEAQSGTALVLGEGAAVRGLALTGTGHAGTVGVAIGAGTGAMIRARAADMIITSFADGIAVDAPGQGAVELVNVVLRETGTADGGAGLHLYAGTVQTQRLTVEGGARRTGAGILIEATDRAQLTATDTTVTDLALAGLEIRGRAVAMPTAVLTSARFTRTGAKGGPGVRIAAGMATLTDTTVAESGGDGVFVEGATLTAERLTAEKNAGDGVESFRGTLRLKGATLASNVGRGAYVQGGTATIEESAARGNGRGASRGAGIRFEAGDLVLTGVEITDSGLNGLNIAGPGVTGSVMVSRLRVSGSAEYGIHVDLNEPGGAVTIADTEVSGNGFGGVLVRRAPAVMQSTGVRFERLTAHTNGTTRQPGAGVWLRGDEGNVDAALIACTIRGNTDAGIRVAQGAGFATRARIEGGTITGNNTASARAGGGISFETTSDLVGFSGNRVARNRGDQIAIAAPAAQGAWRLGATACAAGMTNEISCYDGAGVGVRASAGMVDAAGVSWQNAAPMAGRDFAGAGGALIVAEPACAAAAIACMGE